MEKIEMLYLPVADLQAALAFYRDRLGWDEAWREGETTVALQTPGGELQLMIDLDPDGNFRPGPMLHVESARAYFEQRQGELTFWLPPMEIPGGCLAAFEDHLGNAIYVLDQAAADVQA